MVFNVNDAAVMDSFDLSEKLFHFLVVNVRVGDEDVDVMIPFAHVHAPTGLRLPALSQADCAASQAASDRWPRPVIL